MRWEDASYSKRVSSYFSDDAKSAEKREVVGTKVNAGGPPLLNTGGGEDKVITGPVLTGE